MNCADVDELIGPYALGALPDDDAQLVREHLSTCRRHDSDLEELRATARRIAASVEPVEAPSRLRSRVLAAIDMEITDGIAAPVPITSGAARASRPVSRWTWWLGSAAAAVIVGLLAWNIVLLRRNDDGLQQLASRAHVIAMLQSDGANGNGSVVYFPEDKQALVLGDGLTPLEPGAATYQLWEIADGQPKSIGLMQADATGQAVTVVPFEGQAGHTLAITIEPAGGSPQPTSKPILAADL